MYTVILKTRDDFASVHLILITFFAIPREQH